MAAPSVILVEQPCHESIDKAVGESETEDSLRKLTGTLT